MVRHKRNGKPFDTLYTTVAKAKEGIVKYVTNKANSILRAKKVSLKRTCKDLKERQRRYKKICKDHSTLLSNLLSED